MIGAILGMSALFGTGVYAASRIAGNTRKESIKHVGRALPGAIGVMSGGAALGAAATGALGAAATGGMAGTVAKVATNAVTSSAGKLATGAITAAAGQRAAEQDYQEMQEALKLYEKETKRIQEDIRQQTKLNLQQLDLQRKQQVAAFNQSVFERKLQGLKATSGSQVALAARGLQGGTAGRLLETIQYDTSKDIGVIQENLRNYLAQQTLREEQYRAAGEAQINQYEAQLEMQRQRVKAQEPSFWNTTLPIVTQTAGLFL